jgi:biopolymer transport protein ExbB
MGQSPMELFTHGGPIMWPILALSFIAVTVVIERTLFLLRENKRRQPEVVEQILEQIEARNVDKAVELSGSTRDYIARILHYALTNREHSLNNAFTRAADKELTRFQQGMAVLDTCITAAPLLGLLGTIVGMMGTFASLGGGDISGNTGAITGGVGEALIATACGLGIALIGLLPYNILNARIEQVKHDITDAYSALELLIKKNKGKSNAPHAHNSESVRERFPEGFEPQPDPA